jgi:hypothetical protein
MTNSFCRRPTLVGIATCAAIIAIASTALAQTSGHPPGGGHSMGGMGMGMGQKDSAPQGSGSSHAAPGSPAAPPGMTMGGDRRGMDGMMSMMRQMMGGGMTAMAGLHGLMIYRTEGALAFLRAELQITEAQAHAWTMFADTIRSTMKKYRETISAADTMPEGWAGSLAHREKTLAAQLEVVKTIRPAVVALQAALTSEQNKRADDLASMPMGMMGMR